MNVYTWNTQGGGHWQDVHKLLDGKPPLPQADLICLQECGAPWGGLELVKPISSRKDGQEFDLDWYRWDLSGVKREEGEYSLILFCRWSPADPGLGNDRCSMAIVMGKTSQDEYKFPDTFVLGSEKSTRRPFLGVYIPNDPPRHLYGNVHIVASESAAQTSASGLFEELSKKVDSWSVYGDYNCPPRTLVDPRWTVHDPLEGTHYSTKSDKWTRKDYATSKDRKMSLDVIKSLQGSDHLPVYCNVTKA